MTHSARVLAADIGGGHITAAVVDLERGCVLADTSSSAAIDSKASKDSILDAWAGCLNDALSKTDRDALIGLAFAMPGPFDYQTGMAHFADCDKYESLCGTGIPETLTPRLDKALDMRFINDATAFGVGVAEKVAAEHVIAVTLGTGFGSAFLKGGVPVTSGDSVPEHGSLWHLPFQNVICDDIVSVRWLRAQFAAIADNVPSGVREIAEVAREDERCAAIFVEYGENLGLAIAQWIKRFSAEALIIGGNIAGAFDLFGESLQTVLAELQATVTITIEKNTDEAAMRGAARLFDPDFWPQVKDELPVK